jgi:hypothetical protein
MRVYIWCDGAAMPNGGPAGAGYVVVGGVHLLGWEALGDATNNVAEYTEVRNALRAAADAGATSAHVRMDSPVVFGHLSWASRARAEHLIQHQELYFVHKGHARFQVDGQDVDAPAGTFVSALDVKTIRSAVALSDNTVVLVIGAEPGAPYEVTPAERAEFAAAGLPATPA